MVELADEIKRVGGALEVGKALTVVREDVVDGKKVYRKFFISEEGSTTTNVKFATQRIQDLELEYNAKDPMGESVKNTNLYDAYKDISTVPEIDREAIEAYFKLKEEEFNLKMYKEKHFHSFIMKKSMKQR